MKREEEKKTIPWEVADPKPPVIRSGRMEDRVFRHGENDGNDLKLSG